MLLVVTVCDSAPTGDFVENQPPSTFLTVEQINREGDFRLSSQINISWWGTDSDGFIVGYEYAINDTSENAWTFTSKTDSTFILPIQEGLIEDDVLFKIRAVDNEGAIDQIGARLVFPIINSAPTVSINFTETPPDTLFSIASFGWTIDDPDGIGNIVSTEIAINDTVSGWVDIPLSQVIDGRIFLTLDFDNTSLGNAEADILFGRSFTRGLDSQGNPLQISNINVGSRNTFFVRTTDAAGAQSEPDTVSWFVKPRTSNVLFINDFSGVSSFTKQQFHLENLNDIGIQPDIWLINTGEVTQDKIALSDQFPTVINPTLKKSLLAWDHIYWISNDIDRNITYALDITSEFVDNGGTIFINIPMKQLNLSDEIFNFIPVDSIGYFPTGGFETGFLINDDVDVTPLPGINNITLKTNARQVGVLPIKELPDATLLYQTDFRATTLIGRTVDYTIFEGVAVENREKNLIYFGMDLSILDGSNNVNELLQDLLINRLKFKQ